MQQTPGTQAGRGPPAARSSGVYVQPELHSRVAHRFGSVFVHARVCRGQSVDGTRFTGWRPQYGPVHNKRGPSRSERVAFEALLTSLTVVNG